jgi:hypothetical protein
VWFNSENGLPGDAPNGSVVVTDVNERAMTRLQAMPGLVRVADITDPADDGGTDRRVTFVIFQKRR